MVRPPPPPPPGALLPGSPPPSGPPARPRPPPQRGAPMPCAHPRRDTAAAALASARRPSASTRGALRPSTPPTPGPPFPAPPLGVAAAAAERGGFPQSGPALGHLIGRAGAPARPPGELRPEPGTPRPASSARGTPQAAILDFSPRSCPRSPRPRARTAVGTGRVCFRRLSPRQGPGGSERVFLPRPDRRSRENAADVCSAPRAAPRHLRVLAPASSRLLGKEVGSKGSSSSLDYHEGTYHGPAPIRRGHK